MMLTSVISRSHVLNKPYNNAGHVFLDWPTITKNNFTFVSSTQFTMSRSLYLTEVPKQPLDVVFVMGYVRNSSMGSVTHFYNAGKTTKQPLWTQLNQMVYIDRETRKPTALPEWYKKKYQDKGCIEKPVLFSPLDRPSPTYKQSVVVSKLLIICLRINKFSSAFKTIFSRLIYLIDVCSFMTLLKKSVIYFK